MNCRQAERLCSYNRDQALSERQQQALLEHLNTCAVCRRREHRYRELVTALGASTMPDSGSDLIQRALIQTDDEKALTQRPSQWSHLFGKEKQIMLRSVTVAAVAVLIGGAVLMEMRPQKALGQASLRRINGSLAKAKTMHKVTWNFLLSEEEAKNGTWQDGKKPVRFDTWLNRNAMRGSDEINGPYLWTEKGYLSYDRSLNAVTIRDLGRERPFKDSMNDAFDPLSKIRQSAPPGTYLSVKRLEDTRWRDHNVYKLQIASGPQKPAPDEELPPVHEPGATPPISQGPNVRETFWVDKQTDLPLYSEYEKQIQQRWVLLSRNEYDYISPVPPSLFDPALVRKELEAFGAARQKKP